VITSDEFEASRDQWLPTSDERSYIESIMQPHHQPGVFASWIAPPTKGIGQKSTDFEYVRLP
jgi:benzoyl-CoA 2,3-dioxygenase component B